MIPWWWIYPTMSFGAVCIAALNGLTNMNQDK